MHVLHHPKKGLTLYFRILFILSGFIVPLGLQAAEPLKTITLETKTIPEYLSLYATVEPINQATLYAQTSGRVLNIFYDVNDYVKKGQLLIVLDNHLQQASYNEAVAREKEANASQANAAKNFKRIRRLVALRNLPQARLDQAQAQLDSADARVQQSEAAKNRAADQLSYTRITAPYSGIVTARLIQKGELALPGKPLISGFSLDTLRIKAAIPQRNINAVRQAHLVRLDIPSKPALKLTDITLFPYANPASHTYTLRANLPTGIKGFSPGELVKIQIPIGQKSALMIPGSAVMIHDELRTVYVVEKDGMVDLRQIRFAKHRNNQLEIIAGLQAGEKILATPQAYLNQLLTNQGKQVNQ